MNENKLTPSIRFKNNDGENYPEWEFVKVKEIASINTGNKDTKDAVENGQYDFYVRSPIVHKIDSFSYDGEAVLTVGDGVGVGKVFHYVNGKFDFHQRVYKISDFKDYYGLLFYYYFQKNFLKEAQKYNAKTSVDSVRKSMIADMDVPKIEMSEQIKIGNFFSKLDRQIELEEEKLELLEQQKRGYMQKIFSQDLRFKDENGNEYPNWKKRKIQDLMEVTSVKRIHQSDWQTNGVPFLRARDIVAYNKGDKIEEPLFISYDKYNAYSKISGKVEKGDLLVTGVGTIGIPFLIKDNKPLYFKDGNIIWLKNQKKLNENFLFYSFLSTSIQNYIKRVAGVGTVGTFTIKNAKKTPIFEPIKEEQEKIGNFFSKLDELINKQNQKIDGLKKRKRGFLQKMFV